MGHSTQILSIITAVILFILVAPGVFRMNIARGTTVRNIAIWLMIFIGLIWIYQFMHPEEKTPDLNAPAPAESHDVPQSGGDSPMRPTTDL